MYACSVTARMMSCWQHVYLNRLLPILGLRSDGEGGHGAALSGTVTVIHLHTDEGRRGCHAVLLVDPELQHAEHDARYEALAQACHGVHGLHRQLAEEGQHEMLQQAVAEHADCWRLLSWLEGPTAKLVLHRWAHLWYAKSACWLAEHRQHAESACQLADQKQHGVLQQAVVRPADSRC